MNTWFSQRLIKWYEANKRDLPWRNEIDPYKIWLSEIILQQTQVVQGLTYYNKFVKKYPTILSLACAPEDEVLKLWQGLGYYSRARNLHAAAKHLSQQHHATFPKRYEEIKSLKGIGVYTAAAIASFAYNLPYAVVDGNVYRLLSRLFGIATPIDTGEGKKQFQELANELLNKKSPAIHNQAIMEFGSQYCKPTRPQCAQCIFMDKCAAFNDGLVEQLPVKNKKLKTKTRHFNYLVLIDKRSTLCLKKRADNDIWKGLYEFVLLESAEKISVDTLLVEGQKALKKQIPQRVVFVSKPYKHVLSHQVLLAQFVVIQTNALPPRPFIRVALDKLNDYAFPRLIEKFLQDCDLKEII